MVALVVFTATAGHALKSLETGIYSRIDPLLGHIEPTLKSTKHLMGALERAESQFVAEINQTYRAVLNAVPAVKKTNEMLEHGQAILSSVASVTAHPRLRIDIDGSPSTPTR